MIELLRPRLVMKATGDSRTGLRDKRERGLITPPINLGPRAIAWPSTEIEALIRARIAGATDDELRELVVELLAARKAPKSKGEPRAQ